MSICVAKIIGTLLKCNVINCRIWNDSLLSNCGQLGGIYAARNRSDVDYKWTFKTNPCSLIAPCIVHRLALCCNVWGWSQPADPDYCFIGVTYNLYDLATDCSLYEHMHGVHSSRIAQPNTRTYQSPLLPWTLGHIYLSENSLASVSNEITLAHTLMKSSKWKYWTHKMCRLLTSHNQFWRERIWVLIWPKEGFFDTIHSCEVI